MRLPVKLTDKRPVTRHSGDLAGVGYSVAVNHNQAIVGDVSEEVALVSGQDMAGVETTLWRKKLGEHLSIRLTGPALTLDGASGKASARFVGFGLSYDRHAPDGANRLQVSGEVKLTDKSAAAVAGLLAPAAMHGAATLLGAESTTTQALDYSLGILLPAVTAVLAARSVASTLQVTRDPAVSRTQKAFSVLRAVGDVVRMGNVVVGSVVALAATIGSIAHAWWRARKASAEASGPDAPVPCLPTVGSDDQRR